MAEGVGFEPTVGVDPRRFGNTTRPGTGRHTLILAEGVGFEPTVGY